MSCLSHPEASTNHCRRCDIHYCTGSGCGHTCPPLGSLEEEEAIREAFQRWSEDASRVNARLIGVSMGVRAEGDDRTPDLCLAFKVPCGCPHEECEETEGVILHLPVEDQERLLKGLQTLEEPEYILRIMGLMDKPTS